MSTRSFLKSFAELACGLALLMAGTSTARAQAAPAAAPPSAAASQAAAPAQVVEKGKFRLHKFEQAIGEETYEVTKSGGQLEVKMNFKFTDRGAPVPLAATLVASTDLTPASYEIAGNNSRFSKVDEAVEVGADRIRIRNGKDWSEAARPATFFTIVGYAPTTDQMLLIRYWKSHGSPETLKTFPQGEVRIERRGEDNVTSGGNPVKLTRYAVGGLIWGHETLWFDSQDELVAAVTVDAEFDHFEAIREGYEAALPIFVAHAGQDGMARLAEISRGNARSHSGALAIIHATLIDTAGQAPAQNTTVVTENGLITAIGPDNKTKIPKHAQVVDAHGMSLLPGLWDMHAHFEQVEWGPLYLAAGVTTVRDCGNEIEFITAVRDAIAGGQGLGPRLLLAGIVDGNSPFALGVIRAGNAEQAKAVVDRYHDLNFQQMKIYSSVKPEVVAAIAAEAHRLGMSVTGHIPEGMNAFQGVEAGMDQINHIQYIQDIMLPPLPKDAKRADRLNALANLSFTSTESLHAIDFLKSHGTVVDDTLTVFEMVFSSSKYPLSASEPGIAKVAPELAVQFQGLGVPDSFADNAHEIFEKEVGIVGALHRAGIPIVAGTDQTVPGYSVYREMELYVQAGFTPLEALQAATLVPARVMHEDQNSGSVAIGKRADLILVDGNPMENISNIRKVKYTIAGGALYETAPLWRSIDFQP